MGIFNDNSQKDFPNHIKGSQGLQGPRGPPGIGFELTKNGNFDIDGKRLLN